jgi:hypothetical protein
MPPIIAQGGRGFGAEEQAVRREKPVELVADHARLHADAASGDIERHDRVELAAEVDDDPAAHHLPGQRRARAPRESAPHDAPRQTAPVRGRRPPTRKRHGQRPLLILRGVGRVRRDRQGVARELAIETAGERSQRAAEVRQKGGRHVPLLARVWRGQGADVRGSGAGDVDIEDTFRPAGANTASVPGRAGPFNPAPQLRPGRTVQTRAQEPSR